MISGRDTATRNNLFRGVNESKKIVVYDLETTGLDPTKSSIIQISAIKVIHDGTKFVEIDRFNSYVNPEIPIPAKITEITGITDETVATAPTESEIFPKIKEFFGDNFVASGYNIANFDNKFMTNLYARHGDVFEPQFTIDVIEMARDNVSKNETENFKLGTIAALYGADEGLTFHNSMDDVIATSRLLFTFYDEYKTSYEEDKKKEATLVVVSSISRISFWEGYKGFSRIYITTNIGEVFLDVRRKFWDVNKGNPYRMEEINISTLKEKVFEKAEVSSEEELIKKFTPHKTKTTLAPTKILEMKRWEKTTEKGDIKRIYVLTDVGNFFYDILSKSWASNANSPNEVVDVAVLSALAFAKAGVTNEAEFANYR